MFDFITIITFLFLISFAFGFTASAIYSWAVLKIMRYLVVLFLFHAAPAALALDYGVFSIRSTPAILPSGKSTLQVIGPTYMQWRIYNDTGYGSWIKSGVKITRSAGSYGIQFFMPYPQGVPPNDKAVDLYPGQSTIMRVK